MSNPAINHLLENQKLIVDRPVTIDSVIQKTAINFGLILVGAAVGAMLPITALGASLLSLVVAMIVVFKKKVSVPLILLYSVVEGVVLGSVSMLYESQYPGIIVQAVVATLIVFGVVLALFKMGVVRESRVMTKIFMVGLVSYLIFSLVSFGAQLLGFGDVRGFEVFGTPIGLIIGLIAVLMASYSLVIDFTNIQEAVIDGVDEKESWRLAFGLIVTLVWLYIEILRIIGYLRRD